MFCETMIRSADLPVSSDPSVFSRRHTLRAPPLRANQPPPLRSRLPTPFLPCHCASLPAIRHSAPLHLAHTRCPSPIAHDISERHVRPCLVSLQDRVGPLSFLHRKRSSRNRLSQARRVVIQIETRVLFRSYLKPGHASVSCSRVASSASRNRDRVRNFGTSHRCGDRASARP